MGDTIEHWRAAIGRCGAGCPRKSVTLQNHIAHTSDQIGYKYIRFLVLLSLLIIGSVELNPGPDEVRHIIRSNKRLSVFNIHIHIYCIYTYMYIYLYIYKLQPTRFTLYFLYFFTYPFLCMFRTNNLINTHHKHFHAEIWLKLC